MPRAVRLFLVVVFIVVSCYPIKYRSNNIATSSFYPFILENVETTCVDTTYKIVGYTNSYPQRALYKVDSLVLSTQFHLRLYPDTLCWQAPFFAVLDYSSKKMKIVEFNADGSRLCNDDFLDFSFEFKTKANSKRKIRMTLSYLKDGIMVIERDNPFRSRIVWEDD